MKKHEEGFTAVEGLLIVIVLTVIGFGGFYVWDKTKDNETKKSTTTTTDTDTTGTETTPTDETKNWVSFTNDKDGYSMKIPDGWNLTYYSNTGYLTSLNTNSDDKPTDINYEKGVKAIVSISETAAFASNPADFSIASDSSLNEEFTTEWNAAKIGSINLASGTAEKYAFNSPSKVQSVYSTDYIKAYIYSFTVNGKKLYANYTQDKGTEDKSSLVEKALSTLK